MTSPPLPPGERPYLIQAFWLPGRHHEDLVDAQSYEDWADDYVQPISSQLDAGRIGYLGHLITGNPSDDSPLMPHASYGALHRDELFRRSGLARLHDALDAMGISFAHYCGWAQRVVPLDPTVDNMPDGVHEYRLDYGVAADLEYFEAADGPLIEIGIGRHEVWGDFTGDATPQAGDLADAYGQDGAPVEYLRSWDDGWAAEGIGRRVGCEGTAWFDGVGWAEDHRDLLQMAPDEYITNANRDELFHPLRDGEFRHMMMDRQTMGGNIDQRDTLTLPGATSGEIVVTVNGEASGPIAYNSDQETLRAALEAIAGVDTVTVQGSQDLPGTVTIDWAGSLSGTEVVWSVTSNTTGATPAIVRVTDAEAYTEAGLAPTRATQLAERHAWGWVPSFYASDFGGGPLLTDAALDLIARPWVRRLGGVLAVVGTNQIRLKVYPPDGVSGWGTPAFATDSIAVTVGGVARTITDEGSPSVLGDGHLVQTITVDGAAFVGDETVLVEIDEGAWTAAEGAGLASTEAHREAKFTPADVPGLRLNFMIGGAGGSAVAMVPYQKLPIGAQAAEVDLVFRVDNTGSAAMHVDGPAINARGRQRARWSFPDWPPGGVDLDPAETREFVARFTPNGHAIRDTLTIQSDDPEWGRGFPLEIRSSNQAGYVLAHRTDIETPSTEFESGGVYALGGADPGEPASGFLIVRNQGDQSVTFDDETVSGEGVSVTTSLSGVTLEAYEVGLIEFAYDPPAAGDVANGSSIVINSDAANPAFVVNLISTPLTPADDDVHRLRGGPVKVRPMRARGSDPFLVRGGRGRRG